MLICIKTISDLIMTQPSTIRLSAISLCASGPAVTQAFTDSTLRLLQQALPASFSDPDTQLRSELLGHVQRLLDRLRGASASLQRIVRKHDPRATSSAISPSLMLANHERFVRWLLKYCHCELHPNASYQCHFTALQVLIMIMKSGLDPIIASQHLAKQARGDLKWPFIIDVFTRWTFRTLLDLLMDPFDDIRQTAAAALRMWPNGLFGSESFSLSAHPEPYLARAEQLMLRTGRADQADGVARAHSVVFPEVSLDIIADQQLNRSEETAISIFTRLVEQLERGVNASHVDLSQAVRSSPLHGTLISLRYVIERPDTIHQFSHASMATIREWKALHQRIYATFTSVWTSVRPVLCDDAPEGFVLDDSDLISDVTTKDVLSYCWRALKESSALQRAVVSKTPSHAIHGVVLLTEEEFAMLGDLCFTQLSDLRHRGAFSTVAQTFAACCVRSTTPRDPRSQKLLREWYNRAISSVEAKAAFLTRRSAGLPSLMTGMLCADPEGALFGEAMSTLFSIAKSPRDHSAQHGAPLPQVHAINCLRAIFIHSKLGVSSEAYVLDGLNLAASSLRSHMWAIRNCGLMLFRALIDRMLGTYDSGNVTEESGNETARFSYSSYPTLLDIILQLLKMDSGAANGILPGNSNSNTDSGVLEAVFPALHILQRAPPPRDNREQFLRPIQTLTQNAHWHVRDMAARTLVRLVGDVDLQHFLKLVIPKRDLRQNALHGFLLSLKHFLRLRMLKSDRNIREHGRYFKPSY